MNFNLDRTPSLKVDKITSKFGWDKKSVVWEVQNISAAAGGKPREDGQPRNLQPELREPTEPREYPAMLDIDYMNSLPFEGGDHDNNRSTWSLSLCKTDPEHLGLFLHLIGVEGDTGLNRRFHHNHSFDEYAGEGLYLTYSMSVINNEGEIFRTIKNESVIHMIPGQSWGEEQFMSLSNLWNPALKLVSSGESEKLLIKVELFIFSQLQQCFESLSGSSTQIHPNPFTAGRSPLGFGFSSNAIFPPWGNEGEEGEVEGLLQAQFPESQALMTAPVQTGHSLLRNLWNARDFADVTVRVGDRQFLVHKCVLSSASPVFRTMFTTEMSEARQNSVEIKDLDPSVLEVFLHFLYQQGLPASWDWEDFGRTAELLDACERYEIRELKTVCFAKLVEGLQLTTAPDLVVLLNLYGAEESFKEVAYKFVLRNIRKLRCDPKFTDAVIRDPAAFAPILVSDTLAKSVSLSAFN